MATTWIKALHKGGSIASALGRSISYIEDNRKTEDGELVFGYQCDPFTAQSEFLLSKKIYEQQTGRDQGKHNVIAYHVRMSFKKGEVTAEKALELGCELGHRWTKNRHQFIVAAHTNTNNPHVHIIYNSVNLECNGKYQDFKRSAIALRRVSDQICLENGLSVIEKPGLSKGHNRAEYLSEIKPLTVREQLQSVMDDIIPDCKSYDDFINGLQAHGVAIKFGKQLSFKLPSAKRFIRQDTLDDDYSIEAVLERISGKRIVAPKQKTTAPPKAQRPNLLIDIQAKLQQGYGAGFEQWARIRNLKEASKTLIFLQERGLANYDLLVEKTTAVSKSFNCKSNRIKEIESRLKDISELQREIGVYGKTRDTFAEYQRLKKIKPTALSKLLNSESPADIFYEANRADIVLHIAAKNYFDSKDYGKEKPLPKISSLKLEYATLDAEKRKLYSTYKSDREEMIALKMAKQNVDMLLGEPRQVTKKRIHEMSL